MQSAHGSPFAGHVADLRPTSSPSKPRSKTQVWPTPKFKQLAATGMSPANLMVVRVLRAALPSKPKASFHGAPWRLAEAINAFRLSTENWLSHADHSPGLRFSKLLVSNALGEIMSGAFGAPAHNDPCYYTRRHVVDQLGCQLYALLGDTPPHRFVPKPPNVDKLSRELDRGWPVPPPPWERRCLYVAPKSSVSIESRGSHTFARWPASTASDRGVFQAFDDYSEALEWYDTLPLFLLFTDKASTRMLSAHDTRDSATQAATAAAAA